jgi:hypothetical protein
MGCEVSHKDSELIINGNKIGGEKYGGKNCMELISI